MQLKRERERDRDGGRKGWKERERENIWILDVSFQSLKPELWLFALTFPFISPQEANCYYSILNSMSLLSP